MPSTSFFNKPNFAIGMTALAFLLYLALAKFEDRGGTVAGLRPSEILGSPMLESASSSVMKLWGCEKGKPPPADTGGQGPTEEVGEDESKGAQEEDGEEDADVNDSWNVTSSSDEETKPDGNKKKDLERQLDDMMKVDLRLEALEEKWKEIRKRTHDRVLKSFRRFKKIRNELYGERSETVGNLSATALRQSSIPGQVERLQSQLDFLKDSFADVERSKKSYFERMDTEVVVFKSRYDGVNSGIGAVVERVEGLEALLQKLQGSLAWPQQKIQLAVEEFHLAEEAAKEEAERKAAARRAQVCNKGTFAKEQAETQEQCALLESDGSSPDASGASGKCPAPECLNQLSKMRSSSKSRRSSTDRQFVSAIDDIDPAVFEYPDPSSVEPSDDEEANEETRTKQSKRGKKRSGSIFKSWWGSSQPAAEEGSPQQQQEDPSKPEENTKQKIRKKFNPEDDADGIEGFFPTDRFSGLSGTSETVTEASVELKKIIDEASQLKLDALAVAEAAKKIDETCTELIALKWNILQAQAEKPMDPEDKIQSLPLLMHIASTIDYHATALQDSEKKLMDLKRDTETEKARLISVLNEIIDILDSLNGVSEDEAEMRKLIDERNSLRRELSKYYKIIEEYHCLSMKHQEGQTDDAKANVTAQCTFEGVSGKAAKYADCLTRYMLRIKQMETDTVNYNEDLSHAAVLKEEFTALKSDAQGVIRELFGVLKTVRVQELALAGGVQHYSRDSLELSAAFAKIDTEISEALKKRDNMLWGIFLGVDSLITRLGDPRGIGIRAERIRDGLNLAMKQAEDLCSRFNCGKVTPDDECKLKVAKSSPPPTPPPQQPVPSSDSMSEPRTQGIGGNIFGAGGIYAGTAAPAERDTKAEPESSPPATPIEQRSAPSLQQPAGFKQQQKLAPAPKEASTSASDRTTPEFEAIFSMKHAVVATVLLSALLCVLWVMMGGNRTFGTTTTSDNSAVKLTSSGKGAALTPETIAGMFPGQESIYEYCLEKGLILCTLRCPNCGKGNMALPEATKNVLSLGQRTCSACNAKIPVTEHTVFAWNPHAPPIAILLTMWAWSHKKTIKQARYEMGKALGEAPSLETIESIYMMCKTVAERFLKLCPGRRNEEHYTIFHRFECCDDYILGGPNEVVEVYMEHALPNGDAVFLGKERCSDRGLMRSTVKVTPETIEAFVTQFVRKGSTVILPDNAAHTDLTLIDGYEFTLCDREAAPKSTITRSGHPVTVSLESVLRLWEQLVPEMTNDVTDELHLAIYFIETTWSKYFGCEPGYDPMNTFVEQAAYAFSQWNSCNNGLIAGCPDDTQQGYINLELLHCNLEDPFELLRGDIVADSGSRTPSATISADASRGHYPSGVSQGDFGKNKKSSAPKADVSPGQAGYLETHAIPTAAVTTCISTPRRSERRYWDDDDRLVDSTRVKRGASTVAAADSDDPRWCYIPSPFESQSLSPDRMVSGVNLDMLCQGNKHHRRGTEIRHQKAFHGDDEPQYLDLASPSKATERERGGTRLRQSAAKRLTSVGLAGVTAVKSQSSLVKRFGSRALMASICRRPDSFRSKSSDSLAIYH